MNSKLVVIEGIDGVGKTTQERRLAKMLESRGTGVVVTKQPTDWYRQHPSVRKFLDSGVTDCSQETIALLAATDRLFHIETYIRPALERGMSVLCNRYVYSTYAYFEVRGADMDFVRAINSKVPPPHAGILITLNPSEAVRRIRMRDAGRSKFEERDAAYLGRVQDALVRAWPPNFCTVEGSGSEEAIWGTIERYLRLRFPDMTGFI